MAPEGKQEHAPTSSGEERGSVEVPGYELQHLLGSGGFAHVWAAIRQTDGLPVAIKTIHRQDVAARERLMLEAEAMHAIGPPYVPAIYDTGTLSDGRPFIVLERIDIPTLTELLGKPLPADEIRRLIVPILDALQAAHARDIVHRDIKPENIFVGGEPVVAKLIDFGLAKPIDSAAYSLMETMTGMILGTTTYMAPEQCEGRRAIDARADLYAMGAVVYEMLTGAPPFTGDAAEVRIAHISRRAPLPSRQRALSPKLDQVIARALAKNPEHRFADVTSFRDALLDALLDTPPETALPQPPSTPRPATVSTPQALVGVLFFESASGTAQVAQHIENFGGNIAVMKGSRYVAVFRAMAARNPIERALDAANELIERGLCERVTVDRDRARVIEGRGGATRLVSANFHRQDRFPGPDTPKGVLLTTLTADSLVRHSTTKVAGSSDFVQLADTPGERCDSEPLTRQMIGRDAVVRDLTADAWASLRGREPGLVSVLAESGYGKSSLALAMASMLRQDESGVLLMELRAREVLGGDRDHALRALLCTAVAQPVDADGALVEQAFRARVGESASRMLWPALGFACGWLAPDDPEVARLRTAPAALRAAVTQGVGQALRALAAERPVACILDDAHFAHDVTLDALEYATLSDSELPIWVCVFARPEFARTRPHWGQRAARSRVIELGRLEDKDAARLCRMLLQPARDVPERTIDRLVQRAAGNPLFLEQLVRAIKRQGSIRRHQRGEGWFLAADEVDELHELPVIEWLAASYIDSLPPELAEHARMLALLPKAFSGAEIAGILHQLELDGLGDTFPLDAWVASRMLVEHGLSSERSGGLFEFRHGLIGQEIARQVADDIRARIHAAALLHYQEQERRSAGENLPLIAYHASRCGRTELAAEVYLELADQASARHEYVEAERLYGHSLALVPDDEAHARARLRAYEGRALMHYRQSRFDDALGDLRRARAIAALAGDRLTRATLLLDEATVLDWLLDFSSSRARVEDARELLRDHTIPPLLRARLTLGMGRSCHREGDDTRAGVLLEEAASLSAELGDAAYETRVIALMLAGHLQSEQGDIITSLDSYEACIELCEQHGDKLHLAAALNNRSLLWINQRSLERAVTDALRSQQLGREIGQLGVEYTTSLNLGDLYMYVGDMDAARRHTERAAELAPLTAHRPIAHYMAARIAFQTGDAAWMRRELDAIRRAEAAARASSNPSGLLTPGERVLADLIEAQLEGQDPGVWAEIEQRGAACCTPLQQVELLEMIGLGHHRAGRAEAGDGALGRALERARALEHAIEWRIRRHVETLSAR